MVLNGVEIEDTFAEAFPMTGARAVITAETAEWARTAAAGMTGYATSVIGGDVGAGVERGVTGGGTPGGRPGGGGGGSVGGAGRGAGVLQGGGGGGEGGGGGGGAEVFWGRVSNLEETGR